MAPAQNTISAVSASKYTQLWVYLTILFGYAFINETIHAKPTVLPRARGCWSRCCCCTAISTGSTCSPESRRRKAATASRRGGFGGRG